MSQNFEEQKLEPIVIAGILSEETSSSNWQKQNSSVGVKVRLHFYAGYYHQNRFLPTGICCLCAGRWLKHGGKDLPI